jgi:hypothetical protein
MLNMTHASTSVPPQSAPGFTPGPPLLSAVFWDYPHFTEEHALREALHAGAPEAFRRWVLLRFMRHGRVVDTFRFFPLDEIARALPALQKDAYLTRKWPRILDVYGDTERI